MSIENRVKQLAKTRGLKMAALADKVGMSPSNLLASIRKNPRLSTLEEIAFALNVSVSDLVDTKKAPPEGITFINGETYVISKPSENIVRVPHYNEYVDLRKDIKKFVKKSIAVDEDGAICGYVEMMEMFSLLYDSANKTFSLSLCYGNGKTYASLYPCLEYGDGDVWDENEVIMSILEDIEGYVPAQIGLNREGLTQEDIDRAVL